MKHNLPLDFLKQARVPLAERMAKLTEAIRRGTEGRAQAAQQPEALARLMERMGQSWPQQPWAPAATPGAATPAGAKFIAASFANAAGQRPYKLFVPSGYDGQPVPLLVMLHGCTQSPDDFAAGTRMNQLAEERTVLVAYPGQTAADHHTKCWKWFNAADQQRDQGEPSLIAGITRQVMQDYAVDPRQVFMAGFSAGGAAAANMGALYPDLYAAIGVHSGLACGAARDLPSALAAMRQGGAGRPPGKSLLPTIVFHGDADATVHRSNADAVAAQATPRGTLTIETQQGQAPGGHRYTRTIHGTDATTVLEQWAVHGGGHAWFGGDKAGSYTDPKGPDAAREMLRFFLEHKRPA